LLTHAHWDHVSGVADFPGVPTLLSRAERDFIDAGGSPTVIARSLSGADYRVYEFEGGPYLGFPRSRDMYGDGSLVAVPAPGHTPGSVILFLTLPDRRRFALLGDLVWQRKGITQREEKPRFGSTFMGIDDDPAGVRPSVLRMAAVAQRFPEMVLVPAHDARAFSQLPTVA
jgi:glyoxylase-like metal-dependent hydrolase (beta-lactamase superfamily II)